MPHLITFTVQVDTADEYGIDIIRNDAELHVRDVLPKQLARLFNALYAGFGITVKIGEPSCLCSVPDFWGIQGDITTYRCMRCGRKGPPDERTTVKLISPCIDRTAVTAADIRAIEATYRDILDTKDGYIAYLKTFDDHDAALPYENWVGLCDHPSSLLERKQDNATDSSITDFPSLRGGSAGGDNTTN